MGDRSIERGQEVAKKDRQATEGRLGDLKHIELETDEGSNEKPP